MREHESRDLLGDDYETLIKHMGANRFPSRIYSRMLLYPCVNKRERPTIKV